MYVDMKKTVNSEIFYVVHLYSLNNIKNTPIRVKKRKENNKKINYEQETIKINK